MKISSIHSSIKVALMATIALSCMTYAAPQASDEQAGEPRAFTVAKLPSDDNPNEFKDKSPRYFDASVFDEFTVKNTVKLDLDAMTENRYTTIAQSFTAKTACQ